MEDSLNGGQMPTAIFLKSTQVYRVQIRDYIQAKSEIPRKPPVVKSTPADRLQARIEAQAVRQRIREEGRRDPAVAITNSDMDSIFPKDRLTLMMMMSWSLTTHQPFWVISVIKVR